MFTRDQLDGQKLLRKLPDATVFIIYPANLNAQSGLAQRECERPKRESVTSSAAIQVFAGVETEGSLGIRSPGARKFGNRILVYVEQTLNYLQSDFHNALWRTGKL